MKQTRPPKLPHGLRWRSGSKYIWFTWRDANRVQHQKSTETTDPTKALYVKLRFLEREKESFHERPSEVPDMTSLSLSHAAALYFEWKEANNSLMTVAREKRVFKNVEKFFGSKSMVKSIRLHHVRQYQKERRKQISPTMNQPVTARTVNYELQLLRGVMTYADCWGEELAARYKPLRQVKRRVGKAATKDQLTKIITTALANEYWQLAMFCGAVAAGTGCRGGEVRTLRLGDIDLANGKIRIIREIAKNRREREPRLMALAEWGLQNLLLRAQALGAKEPHHYLLPLNLSKSRLAADKTQKWDLDRPMTGWVRSWRKLMEACDMAGFRFHDLRHTFRTQGAEAGVPLEVMMAQLGHMDRETSLEYVHIQQRALDRAKQLIEAEQADVLAKAHAALQIAHEQNQIRTLNQDSRENYLPLM